MSSLEESIVPTLLANRAVLPYGPILGFQIFQTVPVTALYEGIHAIAY